MRRGEDRARRRVTGVESGRGSEPFYLFNLYNLIFFFNLSRLQDFFPPWDLQPDAEMILINIITLAFVLGE